MFATSRCSLKSAKTNKKTIIKIKNKHFQHIQHVPTQQFKQPKTREKTKPNERIEKKKNQTNKTDNYLQNQLKFDPTRDKTQIIKTKQKKETIATKNIIKQAQQSVSTSCSWNEKNRTNELNRTNEKNVGRVWNDLKKTKKTEKRKNGNTNKKKTFLKRAKKWKNE